jgi:signal transduction histidine kinase
VLLSIIDSVANLGRMEAGRLIYSIGGVTIGDVLARVTSVVAPFAKRQQVDVSVDTSLHGLLAHGDQGKITQILINLLTNAVKFTPAKGVVRLDTRQVGSTIHFIVKDEGPGIPADKLAAIFEPWVQFDKRHNSPLAGYGLGLAVSRELAAGMGGTLQVENAAAPDTGAIFTFSIRVHRPDRPAWPTRTPLAAVIAPEHQPFPAITGLEAPGQAPDQAADAPS